ncbi:MAG TPA: hypothetical protein DEG32_02585, partial [Balneolaceae bacterium]|nr:hypothetical protein [Balneolaceae bacterium]
MDISIRRSRLSDLDLLLHLERKSFPYFQQSSRRTLDLSLKSNFQQVWIAEAQQETGVEAIGSLVLYMYKKTIRIFSVVVDPDLQGKGIGSTLLEKVHSIALEKGAERISLEVYAENRKLINWYKKAGFSSTELLSDYYELGRDGLRMVKELPKAEFKNRISNIIVVDDPKNWKLDIENVEVVSSADYTSNKGMFSERSLRVFNLCNSYKYQSIGYYVSLLASAREHRAIPNVTTIRDFKDTGAISSIADDIEEVIQKALQKRGENAVDAAIKGINKKLKTGADITDEIATLQYFDKLLTRKGMALYRRINKDQLTPEVIEKINSGLGREGVAGTIADRTTDGKPIPDDIAEKFNDIFIGSEQPLTLEQNIARFDELMDYYIKNPQNLKVSKSSKPQRKDVFVGTFPETPYFKRGFIDTALAVLERETNFKKGGISMVRG